MNQVHRILLVLGLGLVAQQMHAQLSVTIGGSTSGSALAVPTATSTPITCAGNDGTITITVSGGSPGAGTTYEFSVDGGTSYSALSTSPFTKTGLGASTYTIQVRDNAGCEKVAASTITLAPYTGISSTPSTTAATCFGSSNGGFSIAVGGGSGTLTAAYSAGASFNTGTNTTIAGASPFAATGLAAGDYTLRVTDALGCTHDRTVTVGQPTDITLATSNVTDVNCFGQSTGAFTVAAASGGPSGTFTYAYSAGGTFVPAGTALTATTPVTGLAAGSYTVRATDGVCSKDLVVTIAQPAAALTVGASSQVNDPCYTNAGAITITASNGTAPYTVTYSGTPAGTPASGFTIGSSGGSQTVTGLLGGVSYDFTITDNKGCTN